ncbi:hypothetical protein [Oceanicella actignis]|uniref:Uncharacterized protein n=1 Tax=Oceanicella actignis TaxID=1189325 RepID=A0A1M7U2A9_9RHOB|nr:hypothetical protein [Oceanicella actignis]SES76244.1 hypothetical protein SAMN04488119_101387 [Oceanicella actignis]SHN77017.1 hypothetical protein SAMN05216200_11435 [Oceanicella actignis]
MPNGEDSPPLPAGAIARDDAGVVRDGDAVFAWTGSGLLNLTEPDPAEICLGDIARNLSRLARYNGATARPYSVAEHSLFCADLVAERGASPGVEALALMHDAAEFAVGDLTRPCKALLPEFKERIEGPVWRAIARRFGLPPEIPEWMGHFDALAAAAEKRDLVSDPRPWPDLPPPPARRISMRAPDARRVERDFLFRALDLGLK